MAYRVVARMKAGQVGLVVETGKAAVQLAEDFLEQGVAEVVVQDLEGNVIDVDQLKRAVDNEARERLGRPR